MVLNNHYRPPTPPPQPTKLVLLCTQRHSNPSASLPPQQKHVTHTTHAPPTKAGNYQHASFLGFFPFQSKLLHICSDAAHFSLAQLFVGATYSLLWMHESHHSLEGNPDATTRARMGWMGTHTHQRPVPILAMPACVSLRNFHV